MPEKKGNWVYYYSKTLNMKYAYNKDTGEVVTEDKIKYTKEEIDTLIGGQITPEIHNIKKIFNGKVVKKDDSNNI